MKLKTIAQRRKTDRERLKRWRNKKLAEGNKQIQLMLTPEAHEILKREKHLTGEPYVQIINRAIVAIGKDLPSISDEIEERSFKQQKMIRRLRKLRSEGMSYSEIAQTFNNAGIETFKGFGKWRSESVRYWDRKGPAE
jgi:hypothetical protein